MSSSIITPSKVKSSSKPTFKSTSKPGKFWFKTLSSHREIPQVRKMSRMMTRALRKTLLEDPYITPPRRFTHSSIPLCPKIKRRYNNRGYSFIASRNQPTQSIYLTQSPSSFALHYDAILNTKPLSSFTLHYNAIISSPSST
ncbi:MAG: hypothetical protein Sylvanvirus7_32 [Sylvanvirus sp.]|uniref:Uncharacterized protein n=1 Tax=Sylvanvirus sp. TaxID=2487774 RepID=A0A3G5AJC8_9VIRU|nr:MAG: hypothetical protein Sylvanvirus7_32 [Sylvanvirus sp.]